MPQGRSWHSLTPLPDRRLLLYGGFNDDDEPLGEILSILPCTNIGQPFVNRKRQAVLLIDSGSVLAIYRGVHK